MAGRLVEVLNSNKTVLYTYPIVIWGCGYCRKGLSIRRESIEGSRPRAAGVRCRSEEPDHQDACQSGWSSGSIWG